MADDKRDEVTEALAAEMGLETGDDGPDTLDDFYASVEAEDQEGEAEPEATAEAPVEDGGQKWVHGPTGKEFESEAEYLRYDNSWNQDKWGQKFKELEEKFETLRNGDSEANQQQQGPRTKDEIKKMLFPNQSEDALKDPAFDVMVEGMDNALMLYGAQQQKSIEGLTKQVEALQGRLEETSLRSQYGVDQGMEQRLLEKHEWLKGLDAKSRMAAMKDLSGSAQAQEAGSPRLMDKIPQRDAADHVESSVGKSEVPDRDRAIEKKIMEADDNERLSIFGQLFERDPIGRQLKGDFEF